MMMERTPGPKAEPPPVPEQTWDPVQNALAALRYTRAWAQWVWPSYPWTKTERTPGQHTA